MLKHPLLHLAAVQEKENVREKYFFGHPVTVQKSPSVRLASSTSNHQVCNTKLNTSLVYTSNFKINYYIFQYVLQ